MILTDKYDLEHNGLSVFKELIWIGFFGLIGFGFFGLIGLWFFGLTGLVLRTDWIWFLWTNWILVLWILLNFLVFHPDIFEYHNDDTKIGIKEAGL